MLNLQIFLKTQFWVFVSYRWDHIIQKCLVPSLILVDEGFSLLAVFFCKFGGTSFVLGALDYWLEEVGAVVETAALEGWESGVWPPLITLWPTSTIWPFRTFHQFPQFHLYFGAIRPIFGWVSTHRVFGKQFFSVEFVMFVVSSYPFAMLFGLKSLVSIFKNLIFDALRMQKTFLVWVEQIVCVF